MTVKNYTYTFENQWQAKLTSHGEFRMGCEGWGLELMGPNMERIDFFQNRTVLVNISAAKTIEDKMEFSSDGRYASFQDSMGEVWIIDFMNQQISASRILIHHNLDDNYLTAFEQPCFLMAKEHVKLGNGRLIYITFPFVHDSKFSKVLENYISLRKRQLEEAYFCDGSKL